VLNYVGSEVSLLIEDDGGKPPAGRLPVVDDETGVGISSMRGRLIELGGRLDLETGDGGGLRLKAQLPLQARPNEIKPPRREPQVSGEERSFAPRRLRLDAGRAPSGLA
jgi:signal transduction histidine kinase